MHYEEFIGPARGFDPTLVDIRTFLSPSFSPALNRAAIADGVGAPESL